MNILNATLLYATLHLIQDRRKSIILIFVSMTLMILILSVDIILTDQRLQWEETMDSVPVQAVISDWHGASFEELNISYLYISLIFKEDSRLAPFISDPLLKRSIDCNMIIKGEPVFAILTGMTGLAADPILTPENGVSIIFNEGFDESILRSDKNVCLINQKILDIIGTDAKTITLDFSEIINMMQERVLVLREMNINAPEVIDIGPMEFTIAGIISGGNPNQVICPWKTIHKIDKNIYGVPVADSMSFTVTDNRFLNDLKTLLPQYFSRLTPGMAPDPSPDKPYPPPAIILRDSTFLRIIIPLERNIEFLQSMIPVLYILVVGIGFLSSFLVIRNRKQEFAVMRSLGTKKHQVFFIVLLESLTVCIMGSLVAILIMLFFGLTFYSLLYSIIFIICFMIGCSLAIINILSVNILTILRPLE